MELGREVPAILALGYTAAYLLTMTWDCHVGRTVEVCSSKGQPSTSNLVPPARHCYQACSSTRDPSARYQPLDSRRMQAICPAQISAHLISPSWRQRRKRSRGPQ